MFKGLWIVSFAAVSQNTPNTTEYLSNMPIRCLKGKSPIDLSLTVLNVADTVQILIAIHFIQILSSESKNLQDYLGKT